MIFMKHWIIEFYESLLPKLKDVTLLATFVRLLLASLFGGMIGMERRRRRRAAGLRTHMLVCIGAALVMITNQYIYREFGMSDPSRLGAQVISGIGFLGVGTIIVDKQNQVKGLTTAAGLWACACMGLALGIGFYSGAILAFVFIMLTIVILNKFENHIANRSQYMEIYTELTEFEQINKFINFMSANAIKVIDFEIVKPRTPKIKGQQKVAIVLSLKLQKKQQHIDILGNLNQFPGLLTIEEVK